MLQYNVDVDAWAKPKFDKLFTLGEVCFISSENFSIPSQSTAEIHTGTRLSLNDRDSFYIARPTGKVVIFNQPDVIFKSRLKEVSFILFNPFEETITFKEGEEFVKIYFFEEITDFRLVGIN